MLYKGHFCPYFASRHFGCPGFFGPSPRWRKWEFIVIVHERHNSIYGPRSNTQNRYGQVRSIVAKFTIQLRSRPYCSWSYIVQIVSYNTDLRPCGFLLDKLRTRESVKPHQQYGLWTRYAVLDCSWTTSVPLSCEWIVEVIEDCILNLQLPVKVNVLCRVLFGICSWIFTRSTTLLSRVPSQSPPHPPKIIVDSRGKLDSRAKRYLLCARNPWNDPLLRPKNVRDYVISVISFALVTNNFYVLSVDICFASPQERSLMTPEFGKPFSRACVV
jgi:hypothetical protein